MMRLGLTGSMAMGKSTTAALFAEEGLPVIDADAIVHQLYKGAAVEPVGRVFPDAIKDGAVDRTALAAHIAADRSALKTLETIVHPLVRAEEQARLEAARNAGADIVVLDIPLLFESGAEGRVDRIVVVSAPADIQRARALARPGMTVEKFETLLARQMPDAEKRARADFIIDTSEGIESARRQVRAVIAALRSDEALAKQ